MEHLDGHALKRLQNRQAELRESPDFPDDFMERWENINELYTREEHYDAFTKRWIDGDASSDTFISRADRIRKSRISEYHRHQNEANYYRKIIEGQNPHGVLKEAGIKVSRLMPSIPAPLKPLEEMDENELLSAYLLGYPTKREIEEAPQKVKEFEDQMEGVIKTIKQLEELATMVREKPEIYSIVLEAIANIKVIRWLAEKLEETESIRQDPDGSKAWLADAYYPFYLHKKKEE